MQQAQNPPQDADHHRSDQSQLSSAFPIHHKNPYDQSGEAENPPSRYMSVYQPSSSVSERSSLLTHADAALSVEKQLSSGWYACYRYWLYFLIISQGFIFIIGFSEISSFIISSPLSLFTIVDTMESCIELLYAITMIQVLKYKKFEKTMLGFKLAVADFILVIVEFGVGIFGLISSWRSEGSSDFFRGNYQRLFDLTFDPFIVLTVIIPAWKIKCLVEKRQAVIQPNLDLYNLPM